MSESIFERLQRVETTLKALCVMLGVEVAAPRTTSNGRKVAPFGHRRWTSAEEKKVVTMVDKGHSYEEVAALLSRTPKAVQVRYSRAVSA